MFVHFIVHATHAAMCAKQITMSTSFIINFKNLFDVSPVDATVCAIMIKKATSI